MSNRRPAKDQLIPLIVADIYQLAGEFRARGEMIAQTVRQTQARWQVLSAASAEPRTVPQIARRLGVTRQGVQRLANVLVRDGLAEFRPNPDHRGSPYLILTSRGRASLARLTEAAGRDHAAIADQLGADRLRTLHEELRHLIAAVAQSKRSPLKSARKD